MKKGIQNKKQIKVDLTDNKKKKEAEFESYYDKIMTLDEKLKRITIVSNMLKEKYKDYNETSDFVNFLHAVEEVFAYAEKEQWSVEKTQKEMIESEIYIISRTTGIDEELFRTIRREFKKVSGDIEKIQSTAQVLIQKYDGDAECPVCVDFIRYVRDSLLIFSRTISGDPTVDETFEAKDQIIQLRMKEMSMDNKPPLLVLQNIYTDFKKALREEK
jgi:CII-binding regulator of phage lambda lysogenization HflD